MPTYEYECPKCPRVFEVRQRITEPALETCDRCGGPIHRLLSAAPFILKGEGWYVTDYPSDARKKATSAESSGKEAPAKETSSAKDGGSAESKPAASSESKSSTDGAAASASSATKPS
jgi:putative FmdB family regulatory protein